MRSSRPRFSRAHRFLRDAAATSAVLGALAWLGLRLVPLPAALLRPPPQSREFTDRHGTPLREVRIEERFAREVSFRELPPPLVRSMLAAEDKRFFRHAGLDPLAIARAAWGNVTRGRVTSGASTITQQLVKISDPRRRTLPVKLLEAARALRLEQLWTKEQILTAYLNRIDFGNLNVGVASAASYYFGKPLADLTDAEAAFLAGLPKNPRRLNPHRHTRAALARQQTVLARLEKAGWLDHARATRARAEALHLKPARRLFQAPHFIDLVTRELGETVEPTIRTTLDLDLNRFVETTLREQLARLRSRNVHDAAAVVIENATGDVLALVGSQDYFAPGTGQVNGAWARRSAGSTFKPFTYLLALEQGASPASIVADVPVTFPTPTGLFRPENYSHRFHGPLRYRLALANSLNIPAVRVLAGLGGPAPLQQRLQEWGMTTLDSRPEHYGLGLTIGNAETRLLELANAYAALARLGDWRPYRLALSPSIGAVIRPREGHGASTTPLAAWLIADMLCDNSGRALAFGLQSALRFDFPVACKTGTSSDFRDNWAVGFTPEFTVAVWAGNFAGAPMKNVSGVTGAAPIMHAVMEHLHARFGTSWYARPPEILELPVHPVTGKLITSPRADAVREKFIASALPPAESPADYDPAGRAILGPEYAEWSRSAQNGMAARTSVEAGPSKLRLLSPLPGTTFLVDPDLPSSGRLPLRASGAELILWECESLEVREAEGRTFAILQEGEHRLTVRDAESGESTETWIRVKTL